MSETGPALPLCDKCTSAFHANLSGPGMTRYRYVFTNGYGASVICGSKSYGGDQGLWELAVINSTGELLYDTPITDDVLGYLSWEEVHDLLHQIAGL